MANSRAQLQTELDEATETLDQISSLVEEALDAELSREEVIGKLKEISDLVPSEERRRRRHRRPGKRVTDRAGVANAGVSEPTV